MSVDNGIFAGVERKRSKRAAAAAASAPPEMVEFGSQPPTVRNATIYGPGSIGVDPNAVNDDKLLVSDKERRAELKNMWDSAPAESRKDAMRALPEAERQRLDAKFSQSNQSSSIHKEVLAREMVRSQLMDPDRGVTESSSAIRRRERGAAQFERLLKLQREGKGIFAERDSLTRQFESVSASVAASGLSHLERVAGPGDPILNNVQPGGELRTRNITTEASTLSGTRYEPFQERIFFCASHQSLRPSAPTAHLMICGGYGHQEEDGSLDLYDAEEFAEKFKVSTLARECSMFSVQQGAWISICKTTEHMIDAEYQQNNIARVLRAHGEDVSRRDAEFSFNLANGRMGETEYAKKRAEEMEARKQRADERTNIDLKAKLGLGNPNRSVPRKSKARVARADKVKSRSEALAALREAKTRELAKTRATFPTELVHRKQNFAVILVLKDLGRERVEDQEPIFKVINLYFTIEEAQHFVEQCAAKQLPDFDVYVVDMYAWLRLEDCDNRKIKNTVYRDPELNRIMQSKRREKEDVEDYKKWCDSRKQNMNYIEINTNGLVTREDMHGRKVVLTEAQLEEGDFGEDFDLSAADVLDFQKLKAADPYKDAPRAVQEMASMLGATSDEGVPQGSAGIWGDNGVGSAGDAEDEDDRDPIAEAFYNQ